jgi:hypothetical protein
MGIYNSLSIQNVTKIEASAHPDLASAPLIIRFEGENWRNGSSEVTIHTDNAELSVALVDAINGAVLAIKAKQAVTHPFVCDKCDDGTTTNPENEYGEHVCVNCEQNAAEAAYERHCEAFHDGGATQFISLADRQAEARKLK